MSAPLSMPARERPRRERGAALLMVLWFAAALSVLVADLSRDAQDGGIRARHAANAVAVRAAIDAALVVTGESLRLKVFDDSGAASWRIGEVTVGVRVVPESGKIDLNAASDLLLQGLATAILDDGDEAAALAAAIADWRDENDTRRLNGAEAREYRPLGLPPPANAPFTELSALRAVAGMDSSTLATMRDAVTVVTGLAEPESGLAPPLVREALDLARGLQESGDDVDDDEEAGEAQAPPAPAFDFDPNGLYTVLVSADHPGGYQQRVRAVIRMHADQQEEGLRILSFESAVLPDPAG